MAKLESGSNSEYNILLLIIFTHTFLLTLNMSFSSNIYEVIKTIQFFNRFRKGNLVFLTGATKLVFVRTAIHAFTSLVVPLSLRQFSFSTGSNKLVFVRIEQKLLLLIQWDQHFRCRDFSIFFLCKYNNANERIGDFFPLKSFCLLIQIFVLLRGCVFVLFGAFCAFWFFLCFLLILCFLCVQNLFVKKKNKKKEV